MARIRVRLKTGQTGTIDEQDFNSSSMEKIADSGATRSSLTSTDSQGNRNYDMGIIQSLLNPFITTGKNIGAAAITGGQAALAGAVGKFNPQLGATIATPDILNSQTYAAEQAANPGKAIKDQLKASAGVLSWTVPFGKGANFATKALVPGGAVGLLSGVSDEKPSNPLMDILFGGATAGVFRGATNTVGKVAKLATEQVPERLMSGVFKESIKASKAALQKEESLGKEALRRGLRGNEEGILQKAVEKVETTENALQTLLSESKRIIPIGDIKQSVQPLLTKYAKAGNTTAQKNILDRIQALEDYHGSSIPISIANEVKRTLYQEARNGYGSLASENIEGVKAIARALKEKIAEKVPQANVLNKELSVYGRIQDSMLDKMTRGQRNNILGITGSVMGVGSLLAAPSTGGLSMVVPAAQLAFGTTTGKTTTANILNKVGQIRKPGVQSGKMDYLIGQLASRLPSFGGNPNVNNNAGNANNNQQVVNQVGGNVPQTPTALQEGQLSPGGQWRYDSKKDDWVAVPQAEQVGAEVTSDDIYKQMVQAYSDTGKVPAALKTLYDITLKRESGGTKEKKSAKQLDREELGYGVDTAIEMLNSKNPPKVGPMGIESRLEEFKGAFNAGDPNTIAFNKVIAEMTASIAKARGGTSFTANEQKLLNTYSPRIGDSEQMLRAKLTALKNKLDFFKNVEVSGETLEDVSQQISP